MSSLMQVANFCLTLFTPSQNLAACCGSW